MVSRKLNYLLKNEGGRFLKVCGCLNHEIFSEGMDFSLRRTSANVHGVAVVTQQKMFIGSACMDKGVPFVTEKSVEGMQLLQQFAVNGCSGK